MPSRVTPPMRLIPPPPLPWSCWEDIMRLAFLQAQCAETAGEVPVGGIIVNEKGQIVGKGYNRCIQENDPLAHAEIVALRDAAKNKKNYRLEDCVLVVTLEPCLMCAGGIAQARLKGVVYGASDAKAGAIVSCFDALDQPFLQHKVWHLGGILEVESATILQNFFKARR